MLNKLHEEINIFVVKKPARAILIGILILNLVLISASAIIISSLSLNSTSCMSFWESIYCTISMILDAGCISLVVTDIGESGVAIILTCIFTVIIGMITFTGAVVGYITNTISGFIDSSESGRRTLRISNHTIILNWNSRASEIINDLLYSGEKEVIVVLVNSGATAVKREISDRIADTVKKEHIRNKLTVIVKEGDSFSTKQLNDISIHTARCVVILSGNVSSSLCKYGSNERKELLEKGNSNIVKTLVQVAEFTGSAESADNQVIVVEVEDPWTQRLVEGIIKYKENLGKCNIICVPVNVVLGQILAQFAIMPELNAVYSNLFSYKGAEIFCRPCSEREKMSFNIENYMSNHYSAIPLTDMQTKSGHEAFFISEESDYIDKVSTTSDDEIEVELNSKYWIEQKHIVIVGHNSNLTDLLNGFIAFRAEWNPVDGGEILDVLIIDDRKSIEKHNYYTDYPYINKVVEADVYDQDTITASINSFVDAHENDTSILILSDDEVPTEDIDSSALTYLIYVQGIMAERVFRDPNFDLNSIDVVVEIQNPKNYDVVQDFSANNIVISNRYISKMVTQISRKESLYEFYIDILTYDKEGIETYESNELYIKQVKDFFINIPKECTAAQLIRGVYKAAPSNNKSIVVGYVNSAGEVILFSDNQSRLQVSLSNKDKLIVYSNH